MNYDVMLICRTGPLQYVCKQPHIMLARDQATRGHGLQHIHKIYGVWIGGTVPNLVIASVADVMSVRMAQMNFVYGELEAVPGVGAAVYADNPLKFAEVTGRKWRGQYRRASH